MNDRPVERGLGAIAILTGIAGVWIAGYAALLLPDDLGDGLNPLGRPGRILQFGFALAIPTCSAVAFLMVRRHRIAASISMLAAAALVFGGWVLTFFDWSAGP